MEERLAPGARTMHIKNGWNFSRLPDGGVMITQIDLQAPEDSDSAPLADIVISDSEWQSIIAGMSAYEDSAEAFAMAEAFHTASPDLINSPGAKAESKHLAGN